MFNTVSFSFTMLLKIGVVPRPKSRQNPQTETNKKETSSDKLPRLERASSDLDELRPLVNRKVGSGWNEFRKSSLSPADRRRRVSQIFGEATQMLAKQENLLRMSDNTTVVKCISSLTLTSTIGAPCTSLIAHNPCHLSLLTEPNML